MARSNLMNFWKLLSDANFTGSPSQLSEADIRGLADKVGMLEPEIEATLRGWREFKNQKV